MSRPLDFGKYLGLFIADVPDSYLKELPAILDEIIKNAKGYQEAVKQEQKYRIAYKKWVTDEGQVCFGKGYEEWRIEHEL
jgi:hypothetical protein